MLVLAVPVLIATGVSVALVAITRGANDRLESAGKTSSAAKREPWEIHDPEYATSAIGGPTGKGGVWSSGIGCIRACHARFHSGQTNPTQSVADIALSYEDEAATRIHDRTSVASLEFNLGSG